jgi:hypothetical protein
MLEPARRHVELMKPNWPSTRGRFPPVATCAAQMAAQARNSATKSRPEMSMLLRLTAELHLSTDAIIGYDAARGCFPAENVGDVALGEGRSRAEHLEIGEQQMRYQHGLRPEVGSRA